MKQKNETMELDKNIIIQFGNAYIYFTQKKGGGVVKKILKTCKKVWGYCQSKEQCKNSQNIKLKQI